jgi:ABC-type branched-subunit amino acid transport system substrate-binding protein
VKKTDLILFLGLLTMGIIFLPGLNVAEAQEREKTITVGLSLIYTGPLGTTSSSVSNGILDHLMWINNQGGIGYKDPKTGKLEWAKMKIIWEDNAYDTSKSVSIYKRLKAEGAKVIFVQGSTPGEAISGLLSQDRIPGIVMYGYASPAGYRPTPLYYAAGYSTIIEDFCTMAKWVISSRKGSHAPKIGAMVMDVPSWRVIGDPEGAKAQVEKMGGEWIGVEWLQRMTTDTSVQINRLINKGVDLITLLGGLNHTILVAKDMSRLGVDLNKVRVICNVSGWDESLLKAIPKEGEGFYGASFTSLPSEDLPGVRLAKEVAHWRGRKSEDVNLNYLPGFVFGYVLKAGLKTALEKVGYEKLTPTDIRNALFSLKDVDVGELMPKVTVREPDYPTFCSYVRYSKMEGAQFKIASGWIEEVKVEYGRK